ncbi:helix-turn-helix domain-containing protein [Xanthomonas translucens]|uniref:helix-turn-helix domain-containing protein n=1 Tax=Xanthomonas campestris pv. translucens TaxID=343 RepID=UPI0019D66465|nr:helix-turn-helix domain-containing protein [Xanthomonas translucens]QSQ31848.1 helix-turn-helix domain-containing protein [Xanthomonas translucens pv. translucens]
MRSRFFTSNLLRSHRGLFLIRNSVEQAAAAVFGGSRFTIYNYIEQIKQKKAAARP